MKAFLLYPNRDFDPKSEFPWNHGDLIQDLELDTLWDAMAQDDAFLRDVARSVVLTGLENDLETVLYRQDVLRDCLENIAVVRDIYSIAVEAIEGEKKNWFSFGKYPSTNLWRANEILELFVTQLKKLRTLADSHSSKFRYRGFIRFFKMIQDELGQRYFETISSHLKQTKFADGVFISASLGKGNRGEDYVLRQMDTNEKSWLEWVFPPKLPGFTYELHPRDESGARALSNLRDRGINLVANVLAQSTDHILGFFKMLRTELAFYLACANLHERLSAKGEPTCYPTPSRESVHGFECRGLYDVCLSLNMKDRAVGNGVVGEGKELVMITGANQGGKSTFLRSVGLAQLMMQAGMFTPAEGFRSGLCDGLFPHFKRQEDAAMKSGKLDEELSRMNVIVDRLTPHSIVLFNESFAATNEREGSEIARQIVGALLEKPCRVFYVTHLYDLARSFFERKLKNALFLRAERRADGTRTFRVIEGEPLETSYGPDLYGQIFNHKDQRLKGELS